MKKLHSKNKEKGINHLKLILSIVLSIILLDQLTKFLVRSSLGLGQSKTLIPKVLELAYVQNTGIAFGMLKNLQWVMIIVNVLIICVIIFYLRYVRQKKVALSLGMILGGAFGNLIDRVVYGTITDFIKVSIWPVFNIADACITIGAIMLAIYFLKKDN